MGVWPFTKIRMWWSNVFKKFGNIPFIFILIAAAIYFRINGPAVFEDWDSTYSSLIDIYLLMMIAFVVWATVKVEAQLRRPLRQSAFAFVGVFIATYIILLLLTGLGVITPASALPSNLVLPTLIIQICVIATAEELIFRGIILSYTGIWVSSGLFALWHLYAYHGGFVTWENLNYGALLFAYIMGVIFALIAKNKNLGFAGSISAHSAYNAFITGALFSLGSLF